jgi:hypothetical protein
MKALTMKRLSLGISLIFAASVGHAQGVAGGSAAGESGPGESANNANNIRLKGGFVTPKIGYFNNSGNPAFLNQYNLLESTSGSNSSNGFIADLDFSLLFHDDAGGFLLVEKEGYGENNQRFGVYGNFRPAMFKAYFSTFKSASGSFDFLYNPDMVLGGTDPRYGDPALNNVERSGYVANFTNDSPDIRDYEIRRNSYGGSLLLRPEVLAERGVSAEFSVDGYTRKGNQVTNYLLLENTLALTLANRQSYQWRGYSNPVNEKDTKLAFNFNWTPSDEWFINYEFAVDKFTNEQLPATFGDVAKWSGVPRLFATGVDLLTPLNFVPDSTQYSNALRLSKSFGDGAALSAGASYAWLQQDSYSEVQYTAGYNDGSTDTGSAFLNGKFNVSQSVGLEAFARYNQRQNNSSYPVKNFYEPVSAYLDPRMVMPRIDSYKNYSYGLEAKLYPRYLKTTWSAGWKYESKENDLTWATVPALAPPISLYGTKYSANEVFVKLVSRPATGLTVRATPSYLWADQTQLSTDPNQMFKFKSSAIYTKPEWNELTVTGYYNYSRKLNDSLSYSDYNVVPRGFADPQDQKTENTMQSFGVNFSIMPEEDIKLSLGYDWNQNDLSTYYFSTNRLRFDYPFLYPGVPNRNPTSPLDFLILDQASYDVSSQTVNAGLEKTWGRYLFSANYSVMWANGSNGDGLAGASLPVVDDTTDYRLQTLSLGMEYEFKKDVSVRGAYIYDRYDDDAYESASGSRNTLWLGINYRL